MEDFITNMTDIVYSHSFMRAAIGMTRNQYDAEDLIQETAIRALRNECKFNGSNLYGWLYIILRNSFINKMRVKRDRILKSSKDPEYIADYEDPEVYIREKMHEYDAQVRTLRANIARLPAKSARALNLRLDGYKYHEIAKITGYPVGSVKSQIFKSKDKLREFYR